VAMRGRPPSPAKRSQSRRTRRRSKAAMEALD
jgi:hypothetical protein